MERILRESHAVVCRLSEVELASAFARRHREGDLSTVMLQRLFKAAQEVFSTLPVMELTAAVVRGARSLLLRHPLRANDAIQLASCLLLQEQLEEPVAFLAFDDRLTEAALLEGLQSP